MMDAETIEVPTAVELPEGEYAIVEMMGHRTMVGRISEVEKFGAKFMALEPVLNSALLPPVLIGGPSIYAVTPCDAAAALRKQPKREWELPESLRAALPPEALPAPEARLVEASFQPTFLDDDDDDDGIPF